MLKSPDPDFCPFTNHLPASLLNIFESISDLKVISDQSWGHIEASFLSPNQMEHTVERYFTILD